MSRILTLLNIVCLTLVFIGSAGAAPFDFNMGEDSWIDTSGTNDVLRMNADVNPNLGDINYSLTDGESFTFDFATIGTTEGWINDDDVIPGNLTAHMEFDVPDVTHSVDGMSVGFSGYWHFVQGWALNWNPVTVDLAGQGQYTIELSDVAYASWWWQGPDGSANIEATVTYDTVPVPEPATMLLLGVGLIGFAFVTRRGMAFRQ